MLRPYEGWKRELPFYLVPAAVCLIQVTWFFIINKNELGLGFPIDDAYIFMQYAENLAAGQGFAFNPGETSFGGTSLAWPVIIATLLRLLGSPPYVTTVFWIGGVLFAVTAVLAVYVLKRVSKAALPAFIAGMLIAASPLLFMNAISGMESPLSMFLLVLFASLVMRETPRPALAGVVAGIYTLNRPEGIYFPLGVVIAWLILLLLKRERPGIKEPAVFLAAWAVLSLPAAAWIYAETGSPLPTTYMGKIMSISPGEFERGLLERTVTAIIYLVSGWIKLALRLRALAALLGLGIIWEIGRALWSLRREGLDTWPLAGRLVLAGYLFLPAAYGFSFPVGPEFGGYYIRYIAPMLVPAIMLGVPGLVSLARLLADRIGALHTWYRYVAVAASLLVLVYTGWLWSFQFAQARTDFRREVLLNTGLRMDAASWIKKNTPSDARIMAGYTGLGVIGACSDRYVLDQGALINPDIFDYYKKAGPRPARKWKMIVKYMQDNNMDYYVTFAFPQKLAKLYPEPAKTAGFKQVKRLGKPGAFPPPLSQIRIYKLDWEKREKEQEE